MNELSAEIQGRGEIRGITLIQVKKSDKAYIYARYDTNNGDRFDGYEVFKRKYNDRFDCESYPSSNAFGIWAWSYSKLDDAMRKFEEISKI